MTSGVRCEKPSPPITRLEKKENSMFDRDRLEAVMETLEQAEHEARDAAGDAEMAEDEATRERKRLAFQQIRTSLEEIANTIEVQHAWIENALEDV
jgi:hypothetical protein